MAENVIEPYIARHIKYHNKKKFCNNDIDFLIWMTKVESSVYSKLNFTLNDLPDEDYWVHFENKTSVDKMVDIIVTNFNVDMRSFFY